MAQTQAAPGVDDRAHIATQAHSIAAAPHPAVPSAKHADAGHPRIVLVAHLAPAASASVRMVRNLYTLKFLPTKAYSRLLEKIAPVKKSRTISTTTEKKREENRSAQLLPSASTQTRRQSAGMVSPRNLRYREAARVKPIQVQLTGQPFQKAPPPLQSPLR